MEKYIENIIDKIYDNVIYSTDSEYSVFNLNYKGVSFYGKDSSRHLDGGGIFDFLLFVVSTHIKTTWYDSIVKAELANKHDGPVSGLSHDAISAMIIDVMKRLGNGDDIAKLPKRFVKLYGAIFEGSNMLRNTKFVFDKFFSKGSIDDLGFKLDDHEVFMVKLVELINEELGDYRHLPDLQLLVSLLMAQDGFKSKVLETAKVCFKGGENSHFYKQLKSKDGFIEKGFDSLKEMLAANLQKMTRVSDFGNARLELSFGYRPHFKTGEKVKVSDFPSSSTFVVDMSSRYKSQGYMKPISTISDATLQGYGALIVCRHPTYPSRIVLVPAKKFGDLSKTNLIEGYKDENGIVHKNIFVSDYEGEKLTSVLEFSSAGASIRSQENWANQFYKLEFLYDEYHDVKGFSSNFLAAYTNIIGDVHKASLQDTTIHLEHMDKYDDPLHNYLVLRGTKHDVKGGRIPPPTFHSLVSLSPSVKKRVSAVNLFYTELMNQFLPKGAKGLGVLYGFSVSEMIFNNKLFQLSYEKSPSGRHYSREYFMAFLEVSGLTSSKLSKISWITRGSDGTRKDNKLDKKQFYETFLSLFQDKLGNADFDNFIGPLKGFIEKMFFDSNGNELSFSSDRILFTDEDMNLVRDMDSILRLLLSHEGYALLQMGFLSFSKTVSGYDVSLYASHFVRINYNMEVFGFSQISATKGDFKLKIKVIKGSELIRGDTNDYFKRVVICSLILGYFKEFNNPSCITRSIVYSSDQFLNELVGGSFARPRIFSEYANIYGRANNLFIQKYLSTQDLSVMTRKDARGKAEILNKIGIELKNQFTEKAITNFLLGNIRSRKMNAFKSRFLDGGGKIDNKYVKIFVEKVNRFGIREYAKFLIDPQKKNLDTNPNPIDLALHLKHLFKEPNVFHPSVFMCTGTTRGASSVFYRDATYGMLDLNYDNFKGSKEIIQPSLLYDYEHKGDQPLSLLAILDKFEAKLQFSYDKYYKILSTLPSGTDLDAYFHVDSHLGFSSVDTLYKYKTVTKDLQSHISLSDLDKDSKEFKEFVMSIVFNLFMGGGYVFIQENGADYCLHGSLRELLSIEDVKFSFRAAALIKWGLSANGGAILNAFMDDFNKDGENEVWRFGDTIPGILLAGKDDRSLVTSNIKHLLGFSNNYEIKGFK